MSPVQSVTDVPVHSSLRKAWFPCFLRGAHEITVALLLRVLVPGGNETVTELYAWAQLVAGPTFDRSTIRRRRLVPQARMGSSQFLLANVEAQSGDGILVPL
jgi:hypothetical protein